MRKFYFLPFFGLAALFAVSIFLHAPASAAPFHRDIGVAVFFDAGDHVFDPLAGPIAALKVAQADYTCDMPETISPVAYRTIGFLKPVYAEALATDALNFLELRRRC